MVIARNGKILIVLAAVLLSATVCIVVNTQNVYADNDIVGDVYKGVPWRITSDYELLIGEDGKEYTFEYEEGNYPAMPNEWPWGSYADDIKRVAFCGTVHGNGNYKSMFTCFKNMEEIELSNFKTENVTGMCYMFDGCASLTELDITGFDTSNVTDMEFMFSDCSSLTELDVTGFDTSNVKYMAGMFWNCSALTTLNVSGFDTGKVVDMGGLFAQCHKLQSIDVTHFDTGNVRDIGALFYECRLLTELDITNFDTSKVEDMSFMFSCCDRLKSIDVTHFDTSNVKDFSAMFQRSGSLTEVDVSGFDTHNVENMGEMFNGCQELKPVDVSHFDTSKVTDMSGMFKGTKFETIDLSNFNTSNVRRMQGMFDACSELQSVDLSNFNTSNVTTMREMFRGCRLLRSLDLTSFDTGKVEYMNEMFDSCSALEILMLGKWSYDSITNSEDRPVFIAAMYDLRDGEKYNAGDLIPEVSNHTFATEGQNNFLCGMINVKYNPTPKERKENTIAGYYSDDFFMRSNAKYDKDLAQFSLLATMASMSKYTTTENRSQRNANIQSLLEEQLGFEKYQQYKYDVNLDNSDDTVGYSLAFKSIEGENVLAVVIRSGGYGGEWASNGRVGSSGVLTNHYGFDLAASGVLNGIQNYLSKKRLHVDKIWICGYSRGGAVSNLLGKDVVDNGIVSAKNLYCYTFQAPMTTHKPKSIRGIYNTVSISDMIPEVPLVQWGYGRHGTNKYIYSSKSIGKTYSKHVNQVANEVSRITGKQYQRVNTLDNYTVLELLNTLVGGTEKSFVTPKFTIYQADVVWALNKFMGGEKKFLDSKADPYSFSEVFQALKISNVMKITLPHTYRNLNGIFQQHWPEVTYAWLKHGEVGETISFKHVSILGKGENLVHTLSTGKKSAVTKGYSVKVYDSEGNLVAEINDGDTESFAENHPDISLEVTTGINGELMIMIPSDDVYYVSVEPTEDITLDYKVSEFTGEGVPSRAICYRDVELKEDDVLTGTDEEDIWANEPDPYTLCINNSNTVEPDAVIEGNALAAVTVSSMAQGNGYVLGAGTYADGEPVTLQALPFGTAAFGGWYENNILLSSDPTYQFNAEQGKDRDITAKFKTKLSDCSISALTTTQYVYNGKSKTPGVTVTCDLRTLMKDTDYTITYKNNKNVGTGTATITGKGVYQGNVTKTFIIAPQTTYITKLVKGKKRFVVKWKKKTKQTTGYQIRYSLKSTMKSSKTVTVKSYKTTAKTIKKLKAKRKYYVQVRTYKIVKGKKYYSAWSKKKAVRTK